MAIQVSGVHVVVCTALITSIPQDKMSSIKKTSLCFGYKNTVGQDVII
jgi:hypothetical protein